MNWQLTRNARCVFIAVATLGWACAQGIPLSELPSSAGIAVVPGELRTFQVAGLVLQVTQPFYVGERPLPFEFMGISVRLTDPKGVLSYQVPIFALRQIDYCGLEIANPSCRITQITVQIPVEVPPVLPESYSTPATPAFRLEISEDGSPRASFPLYTTSGRPRILNTCDYVFEVNEAARYRSL
jgi:hypothetical protein